MIRPQMKRQKEHMAMLGKLAPRATRVITNGGIAGTVREPGETPTSRRRDRRQRPRPMQKSAIANVLPKGTLKSA